MSGTKIGTAGLLLVLTAPFPVAADEPQSATTDRATLAEKMFVEGRVLSERGDVEGACLRFEKSHEMEPSAIGPILNLALCKEALFKYATAASLFREVFEASKDSRPDSRILLNSTRATKDGAPADSTKRQELPGEAV